MEEKKDNKKNQENNQNGIEKENEKTKTKEDIEHELVQYNPNKQEISISPKNKDKDKDRNNSKSRSGGFYATFILILAIFISAFVGSFFGFLAGNYSEEIDPYVDKYLMELGFPEIEENGNSLENSSSRNNKDSKDDNNHSSSSGSNFQKLIEEEEAVVNVVDQASPTVVSIVITKDVPKMRSFFDDDFFFNPFTPIPQREPETERRQVGGGSGFFVSKTGMIITNKHVVSDEQAEYTVIDNEGKEYEAKVIARHPLLDLAIIDISGDDFPVLNLGDSDNLKVGQTVIAIGNSLGEFSNTVSKGIVSGLKRNITAGSGFGESERLSDIIQTDAAINPGNSGGPLFNINAEVIGVNVAMASGAENIGFAIPISQVKNFIAQIEKDGEVAIPYIGVRYMILNETIAKRNNLDFSYGALILRGENMTDFAVIPGSPADKAGLMENDIILEIDGQKVDQDNPLADSIAKYKVGEEVTLKVWHKGETKGVKVKLEKRKV